MAIQTTVPVSKPVNQSIASGGTVLPWPLPTSGPANNYNIMHRAMFGLSSGGPVVLALLDGSAINAGTVGIIYLGNGGTGAQSIEADFTVGPGKFDGQTIDGAGGLQIKNLSAAAGTIHGHIIGVEVAQK